MEIFKRAAELQSIIHIAVYYFPYCYPTFEIGLLPPAFPHEIQCAAP
jgi:hypothetical protein